MLLAFESKDETALLLLKDEQVARDIVDLLGGDKTVLKPPIVSRQKEGSRGVYQASEMEKRQAKEHLKEYYEGRCS